MCCRQNNAMSCLRHTPPMQQALHEEAQDEVSDGTSHSPFALLSKDLCFSICTDSSSPGSAVSPDFCGVDATAVAAFSAPFVFSQSEGFKLSQFCPFSGAGAEMTLVEEEWEEEEEEEEEEVVLSSAGCGGLGESVPVEPFWYGPYTTYQRKVWTRRSRCILGWKPNVLLSPRTMERETRTQYKCRDAPVVILFYSYSKNTIALEQNHK